MQRGRIRFRVISERDNPEVVIGRTGEQVIAFEFRNEGENSLVSVQKDGAGFSLLPGEEKVFALDGNTFFEEELLINFERIDIAKAVSHRALLTETYYK